MWKSIGAALKAMFESLSRTVYKAVRIGGKLVMLPFQVLDQVFKSPGSQAQAAANEGAEQARAAEAGAEKAREIGDYAANLRGLARRRFQGLAIDESLWERLTPELKVYVESLSLAECEIVASLKIKQLKTLLEGKGDAVDGLRSPQQVLTSSPTLSNSSSNTRTRISELKATNPVDLEKFRALIDSSIAKAGATLEDEEPIVRRVV